MASTLTEFVGANQTASDNFRNASLQQRCSERRPLLHGGHQETRHPVNVHVNASTARHTHLVRVLSRRGATRWRAPWCVRAFETLQSSYRPLITNITKYCFDTSSGTETITGSILFRQLENTLFYPTGIGNTPTLTSSKRTQNRNTPFATEAPRGKANTQRFPYKWAKRRCIGVPSKVCCGKVSL